MGSQWRLIAAGGTNQGTRKRNNDGFLADEKTGLAVVCDGVGARAAGGTAARLAIQLMDLFVNLSLRTGVDAPLSRAVSMTNLVLKGAQERMRRITWGKGEGPILRVEGLNLGAEAKTTVVAILPGPRGVELVWAGDSRCYRVRGDRLEQLTRDDADDRGHLTLYLPGLDQDFSNKRLLTDIAPGDVFLLCCDGLYKAGGLSLAENMLLPFRSEPVDRPGADQRRRELERLVDGLVTRSVEQAWDGGVDNTTVVVVRFEEVPVPAAPPVQPEGLGALEETIVGFPGRTPEPPASPGRSVPSGPSRPPAAIPHGLPRPLPRRRSWRKWVGAAAVAGAASLAAWMLLRPAPGPSFQDPSRAMVEAAFASPPDFAPCGDSAGLLLKQGEAAPNDRNWEPTALCAERYAQWVLRGDPTPGTTRKKTWKDRWSDDGVCGASGPALRRFVLRYAPKLDRAVNPPAPPSPAEEPTRAGRKASNTPTATATPAGEAWTVSFARKLARRSETGYAVAVRSRLAEWARDPNADEFYRWFVPPGHRCSDDPATQEALNDLGFLDQRAMDTLTERLDDEKCPSPTPTPTPTATATPTPTHTPKVRPTRTRTSQSRRQSASTRGKPSSNVRNRNEQGGTRTAKQESSAVNINSVWSGNSNAGSSQRTAKTTPTPWPCQELKKNVLHYAEELKKSNTSAEKPNDLQNLRTSIEAQLKKEGIDLSCWKENWGKYIAKNAEGGFTLLNDSILSVSTSEKTPSPSPAPSNTNDGGRQ